MVSLTGLDVDATAEVLDGVGGHVDPAAALRHTGGNPLLLRELAAGGSSPTLQDLLATRCARLTDTDLDVLDTAAAFGESFHADLVAAATELSVSQVINALEHAAGAGLVDAVARQPGRYAFLHALFRDACYEALSAGRRLRIHARVASALAPHASDPTVLPELARHACIAAPLGGADAAVGFARSAGEASLRVGDYPEARRHLQAALDVIDLATNADESVRLALLIRLGEATVQADWNRGQAILRDAARLARRLGDTLAFADAVSSMMPEEEGTVTPGLTDAAFVSLCEEALAGLGADAPEWRARVLTLLARHLAMGAEPERGLTVAAGSRAHRAARRRSARSRTPRSSRSAACSVPAARTSVDLQPRKR